MKKMLPRFFFSIVTLSLTFWLQIGNEAKAQCCAIISDATVDGLTLTYSQTSGTNASFVVYNPLADLYYAGIAGNSAFPLETFNATGTNLYQTTIGFDSRGGWWNPNTNQLEANGYNNNGYHSFSLNANNYALGTGGTTLTGTFQPDAQSVGDYDPVSNHVIFYYSGNIYRYNRTTGALISTNAITGLPVATSNINTTTVFYVGCPGKEIAILDYINKKVYFINGSTYAYSGTSTLPSAAITISSFRASWANNKLWLYNANNRTWTAYNVIGAAGNNDTTVIDTSVCYGASVVFNGQTYTSSVYGIFDTLTNATGCDSLIELNLTVAPPAVTKDTTFVACNQLVFRGITYTGPAFIRDTFQSVLGCDSLYLNNYLTIQTVTPSLVDMDSIICGKGFWWQSDSIKADTTLPDTVLSVLGCDSLYRTIHFKLDTFNLRAYSAYDSIYQYEPFTINTYAQNGESYSVLAWTPSLYFSNQNAKSQSLFLDTNTYLQVEIWGIDSNQCTDSAIINLTFLPLKKQVGIPNAFSPNGDGINDVFRPVFAINRAYSVEAFKVYDRYGQTVFVQTGITLPEWDGTFKNKPCPVGTYYYTAKVKFSDGTAKNFKGDVTLMR